MSDETPEWQRRRHSPWYVWVVGGCLASLAVTIVGCALLFGVFGGLALRLAASQDAQATTTQVVAVAGAPRVDIESFAGGVRVEPGVSGQVTVQATKRARNNTFDAAQHALDDITVSVQSNGNTVTIRSAVVPNADLGPARSVDLLVTTPAQADVQVRQGTGDVSVRGVTGSLTAIMDSGTLNLAGVTLTGQSSAQVRAGSVTFAGTLAAGAGLNIRIDSGDVLATLPPAAATHIDAQTSTGQVHVSGWQLNLRHTTTVAAVAGDTGPHPTSTLVIRVGTGNVTINAGQ